MSIGQLGPVVTVHDRTQTVATLVEQLLGKRSGVYIVTIHNYQVAKIATVDREVVLPKSDEKSR